MRVTHTETPLPRRWLGSKLGEGAVAEADVVIRRRGRLAVKVLVYGGKRALRRGWKTVTGRDPGTGCAGVCVELGEVATAYGPDGSETRRRICDRRYVAVIGLLRSKLTMSVITHESVHAAFAYSRRNTAPAPDEGKNAEERVCYPAGAIAAGVVAALYRVKLLR